MFQKFYTDTLCGRYIKSLLAQTPIPLFDCVVDGDHVIEGCYYVYRRWIIQCASSGILAVSKQEELVPSNTLYPSVFLYPGTGYRQAKFYVKSIVDMYDPRTHSTFRSSTNYYDSETHYHLSRYLRYLYTTTGLNLFPFYNCYNDTHFTDMELIATPNGNVSVERTSATKHKVIAIPILFGHTYAVALDCPTQVLMRACIHDDSGFIEETSLPKELGDAAVLRNSSQIFPCMKFNDPKYFRIETDNPKWLQHQHNLYLVIQLPKNNNSSIVVLENYVNKSGIYCDENGVRSVHVTNLNLLRMNTRETYAFSDRLVEYLVGNVIHAGDSIVQNIAKVQTAVSKNNFDYFKSFISGKYRKGVWDQDLPKLVFNILENYTDTNIIYDQDGNINRDIEAIIYPKGGNY